MNQTLADFEDGLLAGRLGEFAELGAGELDELGRGRTAGPPLNQGEHRQPFRSEGAARFQIHPQRDRIAAGSSDVLFGARFPYGVNLYLTGEIDEAALTGALNDWGRKNGAMKESDPNLTGEDVREGLTAIVSVKLVEPLRRRLPRLPRWARELPIRGVAIVLSSRIFTGPSVGSSSERALA